MQFREISVESQQLPVEVRCRFRTCRELLAVRTIAITFQLEHQKNTAGVRSSCRILHSSFQKISVGYTPTPMAGGEYNRITPSIFFLTLTYNWKVYVFQTAKVHVTKSS
jgi:hypothetical protein